MKLPRDTFQNTCSFLGSFVNCFRIVFGVLNRFWIVFVLFVDCFWIVLYCFWVVFGSFLDRFCIVLDCFCIVFGLFLDCFGLFLDCLWIVFGRLWRKFSVRVKISNSVRKTNFQNELLKFCVRFSRVHNYRENEAKRNRRTSIFLISTYIYQVKSSASTIENKTL